MICPSCANVFQDRELDALAVVATSCDGKEESRRFSAYYHPIHRNGDDDLARFLDFGATDSQLANAAAQNHIEWFRAKSLVDGGSERRQGEIFWVTSSEEAIIPFPDLSLANIDELMSDVRTECRHLGLTKASVWSVDGSQTAKFGSKLLAWGFEMGWQPHWMSMDFSSLPEDYSLPEGVSVVIDEQGRREVKDLPYHSEADIEKQNTLAKQEPRQFWRFSARFEGNVVGESLLFLSRGEDGVAGIYNVGVVPTIRHRGIARAMMIEICRFAQKQGYRYALLNSAADGFYDRVGFRSVGWGQSWWMHRAQIEAPSPTLEERQYVEMLCKGDVAGLDRLFASNTALAALKIDSPLQNGRTPMENVVAMKNLSSAEWLLSRNATMNLVQAYEIGWKDRLAEFAEKNPALVNLRDGAWGSAPLHQAINKNDIELLKSLLALKPDLSLKDHQFHSTPLGWANHFGYPEMVRLLKEAESN